MDRMIFAPILNTIRLTGIPINQSLCEADSRAAEAAVRTVLAEINEHCKNDRFLVPPSRQKRVKKIAVDGGGLVVKVVANPTEGINPNKSDHIREALASRGHRCEDAKKRSLFRIDHPLARLFIRYKDAKALRTNIGGVQRSTFPDGRVRAGGWNQLAARTGRIQSAEPNMQNQPRSWRNAYQAPPGYIWYKADLAQIEMLLIAIHYNCAALLDLLARGKDIYVHIAATVFDKQPKRCETEVSELLRSVAKTLTLGISYVMGIRTFLVQVEYRTGKIYTYGEARTFFNKFFQAYPELRTAHEQARMEALSAETVYTVTGQRRWLPPLIDDREPGSTYWPSRERRARILVNTPIQGSSANLLIRAVNYLYPTLPTSVELVNLVHDEIDLLVPLGLEHTVRSLTDAAFRRAFNELYHNRTTVPVKVEHKLGPAWGQCVDIDKLTTSQPHDTRRQ
jgi:DNA polymerase-1